ncbi:MAG: hypothetical protein FD169_1945 [Bacillota bacterium]|nr:MAG: hypothetical protein FD169_1945 [Bacillota bacterium]MBS3950181.1 hypothetical protein [Peptococcaceae bacterium]
MKKLCEMILFFLANVIRKRTIYVYLAFMALLIFRFLVYEDTVNFAMENRRADYMSWAHFFGTWLVVFLNISVFEEVFSRRNVDGLLSIGLTRAVIFGAAILSIVVMLLIWTGSVLALSTYIARPAWPLFVRDVVIYLILTGQLLLIQAITLVFMGIMPVGGAAIAALSVYIGVGTMLPFMQEAGSIPAWILPLANRMFAGLARYMSTGKFPTELTHAIVGVALWFGIAVYWSISSFIRKDLLA